MPWQDPEDADDEYPAHLEGLETRAARELVEAEARRKLRDEAALREAAWRLSDEGRTYLAVKATWDAVQREMRS